MVILFEKERTSQIRDETGPEQMLAKRNERIEKWRADDRRRDSPRLEADASKDNQRLEPYQTSDSIRCEHQVGPWKMIGRVGVVHERNVKGRQEWHYR